MGNDRKHLLLFAYYILDCRPIIFLHMFKSGVVVWKVALVSIGLFILLLLQYLHNRSLWIDEAMLSLNIINRNLGGLVRPLDDYQVAPVLFLFIERGFVTIFGRSELALRLFPLLCAMASLPLFYRLCVRLTGNRSMALAAMVLLGLLPTFVYYSSEVKQYAIDLLLLLTIYTIAFALPDSLRRRQAILLAATGGLAIFLSSVSVVALCTVGLYFAFRSWQTKRVDIAVWVAMGCWAILFVLNFWWFVKDHPHTHYMKDFWKLSFMPLNPLSPAFRHFVNRSVVQVFRDLVPALPWGYLFLSSFVLYLGGLFSMARNKEWKLLYLCVAPILIHLLVSALKLYPFDLRLILYQAPLYIIVLVYGLHHFWLALAKARWRPLFLALAVLLLSFRIALKLPINHDEIKPAIDYINRNQRPGQSLYVFWGSIPATRYYYETGRAHFDSLSIYWGEPRTVSSASYLRDLQNIHGMTWLLISHLYPYNGDRTEEWQVIDALKRRGRLLDRQDFLGSTVYRFDLE